MVPLLESALVALEAGLVPTPGGEVRRMVAKLAVLYPDRQMTDEEADARLALYVELLEDIPPDLLAAAFKAAAQRIKFFPSVAEIREFAAWELMQRNWRRWRAGYLIEKHRKEWQAPVEISEAERQEVAAGLRDLAARLGAVAGDRRHVGRAAARVSAAAADPKAEGGDDAR